MTTPHCNRASGTRKIRKIFRSRCLDGVATTNTVMLQNKQLCGVKKTWSRCRWSIIACPALVVCVHAKLLSLCVILSTMHSPNSQAHNQKACQGPRQPHIVGPPHAWASILHYRYTTHCQAWLRLINPPHFRRFSNQMKPFLMSNFESVVMLNDCNQCCESGSS